MNEVRDCWVEPNKLALERQTPHICSYMWNLERQFVEEGVYFIRRRKSGAGKGTREVKRRQE